MSTSSLRLDRLPFERVKSVQAQVRQALHYYRPAAIESAPEEIALKKKGMTYPQMERDHALTVEMLCGSPLLLGNRVNFAAVVLDNPDNYLRAPIEFGTIETARRLIFGEKQLTGLQVASNYAPYLYYLRDQLGIINILGIDPDIFAVNYAHRIGNLVLRGDAAALPIKGQSLDVVISFNFLASNYLYLVERVRGCSAPDCDFPNFGRGVLAEIYQILKPGGWFLSDLEMFGDPEEAEVWEPFGRRQRYSPEARQAFPELLDRFAAFQKPVI
jgi:SAM-dependent methyltransferase